MAERLKIDGNFLIIFEDGNPSIEYIRAKKRDVVFQFDANDQFEFYLQTLPIGVNKRSFDSATIIDNTTGSTFASVAALKTFLNLNLAGCCPSGGGGGGGVASVTGDGVDNTDPVNPVMSFPNADQVDDSTTTNKFATGTNTGDETTLSIQTKRPLKTVDGQSLEGSGNIPVNIGVASVTGDGVGGTSSDPVMSFPDADQVDDSATTNKFATASQLNQIATNVSDISNNTSNISLKRNLTSQKNSIEDDGGDLQLVGDLLTVGNDYYYGTDVSGVKGWQKLLRFNVNLDSTISSVSRVVAGGRTVFTITHNLNTLDLQCEVFRLSNGRSINWRIDRTAVNTIEASRAGTVANGLFKILIRG